MNQSTVHHIAGRVAHWAITQSRQAINLVDVVDLQAKPVLLPPAVKSKANKLLSKMTTNVYFDSIPLEAVFKVMEQFGVIIIQEDGSPWSGFITGAQGQANFDMGWEGRPIKNASLSMSWYKMPSGRYEIVAYVA
jgi:hypothetical protein